MSNYYDEIRSQLDPSALTDSVKYAPKLNDDERRACIALSHMRVRRIVICRVYGINLNTLRQMVRRNSKFYKKHRQLFDDMGADAFCKKYITPDVMDRVNRANREIADQTYAQQQAMNAELATAPDARATKYAGRRPIYWFGSNLTVNVLWCDNPPPLNLNTYAGVGREGELRAAGWYFMLEGEEYETLGDVYGSEADSKTSSTCYHAAVAQGDDRS